MAFHVACPITCKRICFCTLGFPRKLQSDAGRSDFLEEILKVDEFLTDPWLSTSKEKRTVQVPIPKVAPPPPPQSIPADLVATADVGATDGMAAGFAAAAAAANELLLASSAQTKRAALQRKAAVASSAAEDFARRFEAGTFVKGADILKLHYHDRSKDMDALTDAAGVEQEVSNGNVMCRLCFSGENESTEKARRMFPCRRCGKKYHRNCLKTWSHNRDLFHWSSWTCPSCRICEVCRRTGDPNKFKYCRRCDAAYHCYCMQPPHKNVSSGPYLCPKHTKCHSCGSNVPGNGLSLRWFLGYTCCDACGRLFTKGNYCPVCLKVYRDSESTPMVCCDICQRWVHCQCDAISDEKYLQFQVDGNLPYTCPTCRGECYQVKDLEDAVRELWRRKDEADQDLIANLRAAAGLPTHGDIFSISPFLDDDDNDPFSSKSERGRVKFSLKSSVDGSPKKNKNTVKKLSSKKHSKKKLEQTPFASKAEVSQNVGEQDGQSFGYEPADMSSGLAYSKSGPGTGSGSAEEGMCSIHQQGALKHKFMNQLAGDNERTSGDFQIRSKVTNDAGTHEDVGKVPGKSHTMKGTKLVIHLSGRNKSITNSPRSDSSSYQREQESAIYNGSEAISQHKGDGWFSVERLDGTTNVSDVYKVDSPQEFKGLKHMEKEGSLIRLGKGKSVVSGLQPKYDRNGAGGNGLLTPENAHVLSSKKRIERSTAAIAGQSVVSKASKAAVRKHPEEESDGAGLRNTNYSQAPCDPFETLNDPKPLLRLKFKNPYKGSWHSHDDEEKSSVKGQRSKRKRPSPVLEKSKLNVDDAESQQDDNSANWILKKLGRDAIGKRLEVHQQSDNSWHKGVVSDVTERTSMLSVDLDDGRSKKLQLENHRIRFAPQKQKRRKN